MGLNPEKKLRGIQPAPAAAGQPRIVLINVLFEGTQHSIFRNVSILLIHIGTSFSKRHSCCFADKYHSAKNLIKIFL